MGFDDESNNSSPRSKNGRASSDRLIWNLVGIGWVALTFTPTPAPNLNPNLAFLCLSDKEIKIRSRSRKRTKTNSKACRVAVGQEMQPASCHGPPMYPTYCRRVQFNLRTVEFDFLAQFVRRKMIRLEIEQPDFLRQYCSQINHSLHDDEFPRTRVRKPRRAQTRQFRRLQASGKGQLAPQIWQAIQ